MNPPKKSGSSLNSNYGFFGYGSDSLTVELLGREKEPWMSLVLALSCTVAFRSEHNAQFRSCHQYNQVLAWMNLVFWTKASVPASMLQRSSDTVVHW